MKKFAVLFLLVLAEINLFALSVDGIAVPWTTGLRIRETPSTSGKEIAYLGLWEKLTVLEIKKETETINGNTGNWVKIRRENSRVTGWCFSYFLEEIDVNNFYPVLEYRGWAHAMSRTGYGSREVYTLYNDGKKRDKLVLYWNNKTINTFDNLTVSDNGRIIAFNWTDPATIKRNSREGTISGNRLLFVYNFANHRLLKIDEYFFTESDQFSDRWKGEWDIGHGEYADGFYHDRKLERFILNSDGTKLFYANTEVDLISNNRVNHQINLDTFFDRYFGNYIYMVKLDKSGNILYDPVGKKTIMTIEYHWSDPNGDGSYNYPVIIFQKRYLVINLNKNGFTGKVIHDLVTGKEQRIKDIDLYGPGERKFYLSEIIYQEDGYYIKSSPANNSVKNIMIHKIDYNNKILAQYTFDDIASKMSSFTSSYNISNNGIVEFNYGDQAWMKIYLFNNTVLEYRFDDGNYKGSYEIYLMNKY
jgi:hypothetical protein